MADTIGMMEGAFFVSRGELLGWINDLLKLNVAKVEQLGTGAIYCQLLDACFPGEVPLHKVNWKAKHEYEFVSNFKILQQAFDKLGVKRNIPVERLIMAKYQDNLEFGQWMKRFYELKFGTNHNGYDAQGRRGKSEVDFGLVGGAGPKESKKTKTKEEASHATLKKARMSDIPTITEKNKENVTTSNCLKLEDYGKVKTERDNLREKLRNIEDILSSTQDDTLIVKSLKEYLGISNNTKLELSGSKQC